MFRTTRTTLRLALMALVAAAAVISGTTTASAAPPPANDTDPSAASAVLPPRDPGTWFIKKNGLTAQDFSGWGYIKLTNFNPVTTNPSYSGVLWHFTPVPNKPGTYFVENHNGGCLDVFDGISTASGAQLDTRLCDGTLSQQWFTPYKNGQYGLTNQWSKHHAAFKHPSGAGTKMTQQAFGSDQELYFDMPFYAWSSS